MTNESDIPTRETDGFSLEDWWGFDTYICGVIARACILFRDHGHGHPNEMTPEQWDQCLEEIAAPLFKYSKEFVDQSMQDYHNAVAAMHKFADHLGSMWD